jgi:pimeloyl-ACP methyl ester carboxylesterase
MLEAQDRDIRLRDGRVLAYAEYGRDGGQPIIHCHGSPSSRVEGRLFWAGSVAAELGVRIIIPDRPGMGRSTFLAGRRVVDWPNDVIELADSLGIGSFTVLGESGGGPYAAACGALLPDRVRAVGLLNCVAPLDVPGLAAALSGPLRMMFRLARSAPSLLRLLFRLNLRAIQGGGQRGAERMASSFPEPDRTLLRQRADVRDGFMACFTEACRHGVHGPVWDCGLIARPWGVDLATIKVPAVLWQGERDGNVPAAHGRYLAGAIPNCRSTFYPDEAHLSLPLNHQREILSDLMAVAAQAG